MVFTKGPPDFELVMTLMKDFGRRSLGHTNLVFNSEPLPTIVYYKQSATTFTMKTMHFAAIIYHFAVADCS